MKVLETQFDWEYYMQPDELSRSVAYEGARHRLRTLLDDLSQGRKQRLRLAVIGGSISWGSAVNRGKNDWFSLVTKWLTAAYPAVNVTGINGCVPATPSAFMELCLEKHIGPDADLVFMEYATNDGYLANSTQTPVRRTFERLVRKVSSLPSRPPVVIVHLPTKGQAYSRDKKDKRRYYETLEDQYNGVASYYQASALSLRDAVWHIAEIQKKGNWSDYYGDWDGLHPIYTGHRAIADMVVWLLQRTAVGVMTEPVQGYERELAEKPLPEPMYTDNWDGPTRLCLHGGEFESSVRSADGFQLINEGRDGKQKWGYVATKPGSKLVFSVNTTRVSDRELPTMNVMLALLKSYEHMGTAEITCDSGCRCSPVKLDANQEVRISTINLLRMNPTQAEDCRIGVRVLEATTSGEHKFKVTGVMTSESKNSVMAFLNTEEFAGHVNKGSDQPPL